MWVVSRPNVPFAYSLNWFYGFVICGYAALLVFDYHIRSKQMTPYIHWFDCMRREKGKNTCKSIFEKIALAHVFASTSAPIHCCFVGSSIRSRFFHCKKVIDQNGPVHRFKLNSNVSAAPDHRAAFTAARHTISLCIHHHLRTTRNSDCPEWKQKTQQMTEMAIVTIRHSIADSNGWNSSSTCDKSNGNFRRDSFIYCVFPPCIAWALNISKWI